MSAAFPKESMEADIDPAHATSLTTALDQSLDLSAAAEEENT